jgi:hypothetical protein
MSDTRVIHKRQSLPLSFEPLKNYGTIPVLQQLDGDLPPDGHLLLTEIYDAHSALTQ